MIHLSRRKVLWHCESPDTHASKQNCLDKLFVKVFVCIIYVVSPAASPGGECISLALTVKLFFAHAHSQTTCLRQLVLSRRRTAQELCGCFMVAGIIRSILLVWSNNTTLFMYFSYTFFLSLSLYLLIILHLFIQHFPQRLELVQSLPNSDSLIFLLPPPAYFNPSLGIMLVPTGSALKLH